MKNPTEYDLMKYRLASKALGIAHWDMDIADSLNPVSNGNKIVYSPEFRRMLGYSGEKDFPDVLSSVTTRVHPGDARRTLSSLAAHIKDRSGKTPFYLECRLMTKQGEYRYFLAFGETLRDAEGLPLRTAGAIWDITNDIDLQRTTESILNGMDALITVCSPDDFSIYFINYAIRDYFGIKDSGVGKKCYEVLQKRDAPCVGCPHQQLIENPGKTLTWEHREFVRGSILHKTARLIDWPGGKKAHLEYAIDITPLVRAEESLERRGRMLDSLNKASKIFLSQGEETFGETMSAGFACIAEIANIDRMSVSRNILRPDGLHASQIYRWIKETGSAMTPLEELQDNPYAKDIPRWAEVLASDECVNGPARLMPEAEALKHFGCVSVLATPVFDKGEFWGFVVFLDMANERTFSEDEVDILRSAGFMLVNAITRHERDEKIARQNMLLQAVNRLSSIMLSSKAHTFDSDVTRSMAIIAEAVDIDRVYLWKNSRVDGEPAYTQFREWSRGAEYAADNRETLLVSVEVDWYERLSENECVSGVLRDLPPSGVREHLSSRGTKSFIYVPVFLYGEFWGFFGYDDCRVERVFHENEENILRAASELIAEALVRHDMEEHLLNSSVELQRALAEAKAANSAKSEFLSSMSHEMRTPLNAVIGMTAIGKRAGAEERKNYAFNQIEEASAHLLNVINDILDMSKIEAGKMELSPVEFNLEKTLQRVISVINNRINEKRQLFSVSIDKDVPRFLVGDDQRISQIMTNLLSNASKFTPEGGRISLHISLLNQEGGSCEIRVEVADTGIGISPEQQAKLFKSFTQADGGITREYGGTGLGLAIAKRLVELMDGRIWIESELGKGASFIFTAKLQSGANDLRSLLRPNVTWNGISVLAVDGSPAVRRSFGDSFERLGMQCALAEDSSAAYRLIEDNGGFDICFINWNTNGADSIKLARWIKARTDKESVVVLTSASDWETLQEAVRDAGADRGIVKPILSSMLVDCMNNSFAKAGISITGQSGSDFDGRRMLLAEDIAINQEIIVSLLEETGIVIECVENGRDALLKMEEDPEKYDVVFMDMQMPVMDGLEATRRIRALPSDWCGRVPIIAMTANVFKSDIERCLSAGMDDHIGKPVDLDDMTKKLRKHLKRG